MLTRNGYVKLARLFSPHRDLLKVGGVVFCLVGFICIAVVAKSTGRPDIVVLWGGRFWFSVCVILGVIYAAVESFNPERDMADHSSKEDWAVIVLNIGLLMAIAAWFME